MSKPVKNPTTFKEQIELLKSRGCIITNEQFCLEKLQSINYYRLSAYFLPFKNPDNTYKAGTTFNQVYNIYEFDRGLRSISLAAIYDVVQTYGIFVRITADCITEYFLQYRQRLLLMKVQNENHGDKYRL
jgi:abortive infection bacteriophage resistance protein